jgi:hypothetical protein
MPVIHYFLYWHRSNDPISFKYTESCLEITGHIVARLMVSASNPNENTQPYPDNDLFVSIWKLNMDRKKAFSNVGMWFSSANHKKKKDWGINSQGNPRISTPHEHLVSFCRLRLGPLNNLRFAQFNHQTLKY